MLKHHLLRLIICLCFILISTSNVLAQHYADCTTDPRVCDSIQGTSCQGTANPNRRTCQPDPFVENFGKIQIPNPLKDLLSKDPTGTAGISKFLSNLIALIYSVAAIVLIFMLVWGAFEWLTSGGDKERIESARRRIISALIGMLLFAVAFAVIQVLGQFTGFKFFQGQGVKRIYNNPSFKFECPDGTKVGGGSDDPEIACKGHGT